MPIARLTLCAMVLVLVACREAPPDPVCPAEAARDLPPERGALQVDAATPGSVAIRDPNGTTLVNVPVGERSPVPAGDYVVALNGSTRRVRAERGWVTRCRAGDVVAVGPAGTAYAVLDTAGTTLVNASLGRAVALLPGEYRVRANGSLATAVVTSGARTEARTGFLLLAGEGDFQYAVLDSAATTLAHGRLGGGLALFPGRYQVRLNGSLAGFAVTEGAATELRTGSVVVTGTTDASFAVQDTTGTTLAHHPLGSPLAVMPGRYALRVSGRIVPAEVLADRLTEFGTGTLVVRTTEDRPVALAGEDGSTLAHPRPNEAVSLLPGTYLLRIGNREERITVVAGGTLALPR